MFTQAFSHQYTPPVTGGISPASIKAFTHRIRYEIAMWKWKIAHSRKSFWVQVLLEQEEFHNLIQELKLRDGKWGNKKESNIHGIVSVGNIAAQLPDAGT